MLKLNKLSITIEFSKTQLFTINKIVNKYIIVLLLLFLSVVSIYVFVYYLNNHLGLAYNDARSHLDIGRRVVENLKPGFAQLGSVWLPLPHLLMTPTVWNDFMWHSGLSGALLSMISYVMSGTVVYLFLKRIGVGLAGRLTGVAVFAFNLNVLYMQSTAMTELLLIATMTIGTYELVMWHLDNKLLNLLKSAFCIMLSTLIRYDGWFLFAVAAFLVIVETARKKEWHKVEGMFILFCTLAGFGIALWLLWNLLIFKDPFYFLSGPYSAQIQQLQLEKAGNLATKGNLLFSIKIYFYALIYNSILLPVLLSILGLILFVFDKKLRLNVRIASLALLSPLVFNILALYIGQSVLFIQGLSGNSWFNVRYGILMLPTVSIFIGFLVHKLVRLRVLIIGLLIVVMCFSLLNKDAVTVDDARVGSSGKNVTEVSGWLSHNAANKSGFVLISVASHDAIIFSSGMQMKRFIHEGTGLYWDKATVRPDLWARFIIMRTNDNNDMTFKLVKKSGYLDRFAKVKSYPFADIYELKKQYLSTLITKPILGYQK
jgi:hypothetical protein